MINKYIAKNAYKIISIKGKFNIRLEIQILISNIRDFSFSYVIFWEIIISLNIIIWNRKKICINCLQNSIKKLKKITFIKFS